MEGRVPRVIYVDRSFDNNIIHYLSVICEKPLLHMHTNAIPHWMMETVNV